MSAHKITTVADGHSNGSLVLLLAMFGARSAEYISRIISNY